LHREFGEGGLVDGNNDDFGGRGPLRRNRISNPLSSKKKRKERLVTTSTATKAPAAMRPAFRNGQNLSFICFLPHSALGVLKFFLYTEEHMGVKKNVCPA
jgi:hypothetical protein